MHKISHIKVEYNMMETKLKTLNPISDLFDSPNFLSICTLSWTWTTITFLLPIAFIQVLAAKRSQVCYLKMPARSSADFLYIKRIHFTDPELYRFCKTCCLLYIRCRWICKWKYFYLRSQNWYYISSVLQSLDWVNDWCPLMPMPEIYGGVDPAFQWKNLF